MKKIIALSTLAVSLAVPSVFGQGYMQVTGGFSQALDGFTTPGTLLRDSLINVALLWAPSGTANPMPLSNTPTTEPYSLPSGAWGDIYPSGTLLSGWHVAVDNGDSDASGGQQIIMQTTSRGAISWNAGLGVDITGTPSSGPIALMEIGWISSESLSAAIGNSAFGWSYQPSFTLVSSSTDTGISSPSMAGFGVYGSIPEPTTLALAGLGGLSLLFLRRKKA
jgi:hypothetical protein